LLAIVGKRAGESGSRTDEDTLRLAHDHPLRTDRHVAVAAQAENQARFKAALHMRGSEE
jgi:hypothetical protein